VTVATIWRTLAAQEKEQEQDGQADHWAGRSDRSLGLPLANPLAKLPEGLLSAGRCYTSPATGPYRGAIACYAQKQL